jgi:hypothetical protein
LKRTWIPLVVAASLLGPDPAVAAPTMGGRLVTQQVTIDRANDERTLTVRYSGAKARSVELRINGKSVAVRYVNPSAKSGETNFELDTDSLLEGENAVEVRIYDASGRVLAFQKTTVTAQTKGSHAIYLAKPAAGASVQGSIEVSVGFKVAMKNVYVSFFVDDDLKSIRNFAPYSYLWDTTKLENGWHEVQAWVVDQDTQTYKTERLRVYVNNPGGRTERAAEPVEPAAVKAPAAPAVAGMPAASLPAYSEASGTKPLAFNSGIRMGLRTMRPGAPKASVPHAVRAPQVPPVADEPKEPVVKAPSVPVEQRPAVAPAERTAKPEPVKAQVPPAAEPPQKAASPARLPGPTQAKPSVPAKPEPPRTLTARVPRLSVEYGSRLPDRASVGLTVDGAAVASDVSARIEDGIALAPFRALYEHFGGTVRWENSSKTVLAQGPGGTIEIRIGSSFATVEQAKVALERAAHLLRGRTIVPVSFFSAALGFDVQYDASSGHLIVTNARKG